MQLTRLDEGRLEHVGEQGQDGVEGSEVLLLTDLAVLDAGEELAQDSQVQDQGSGEEGVLRIGSAWGNDEEKSKLTSHSLKMLMVERPPQKISE